MRFLQIVFLFDKFGMNLTSLQLPMLDINRAALICQCVTERFQISHVSTFLAERCDVFSPWKSSSRYKISFKQHKPGVKNELTIASLTP